MARSCWILVLIAVVCEILAVNAAPMVLDGSEGAACDNASVATSCEFVLDCTESHGACLAGICGKCAQSEDCGAQFRCRSGQCVHKEVRMMRRGAGSS